MSPTGESRGAGRDNSSGSPDWLPLLGRVLLAGACYYAATRIAWALCFPDSKVSLFFPPHAVLVAILLAVPTRHWWAYALAAAGSHFFATQQAGWPFWYAAHCEVFDAFQNVGAAAGLRWFIRSPLNELGLRDALMFVLIAGIAGPFLTAFWGAALTVWHGFGTNYWIEWRNLGISNAVTAIVLVPVLLLAPSRLGERRYRFTSHFRVVEATLLAGGLLTFGYFAFGALPAGPAASPALLYASTPFLIWAAIRFGLWGISASMLFMTVLAIWGAMQGRGPFLTQTPVENATELQLFLLFTAAPLMLLAVVIEEERRMQESLRESQERMRLAADAAQLGMWVWDVVEGDGWMTEQGRSLFGFNPAVQVNPAAVMDRVHPEDRALREAAIRRALETNGDYQLEYRLQLENGAVRWISARGRCAGPANGLGAKLMGVSMDVTERKEAEFAAAQQHAEMGHLSRVALVGEMATSLAHELNQPLTAIAANASAAQRFLAKGRIEPAELQALLADIAADGRRAGEIIRGIRGMVRKSDGERQALDLNEVVADVLRLVRADALAHSCVIATELAPAIPQVLGEAVQLQQVLLNLIINGFDAMSSLPAPARRLEIRSRAFDSAAEVSIRDFGPGLSAEARTRVFDRFFSTKRKGLGMGLAIARSIIEAHSGTLEVENAEGGGARFWFRLPVRVGHNGALAGMGPGSP